MKRRRVPAGSAPQRTTPGFANAPPAPGAEPPSEGHASVSSRPLTARELIAMARSARKIDPIA